MKYGGAKKVEQTYFSKEGDQRRCAVYSEFKNRIPKSMKEYIDKQSSLVVPVQVNTAKFQSLKNFDNKLLLEDDKHKWLSNNNINAISDQFERILEESGELSLADCQSMNQGRHQEKMAKQ